MSEDNEAPEEASMNMDDETIFDKPESAGLPLQSPNPVSSTECFVRIRDVLRTSCHKATMSVNAAMVQAYWEIGREIVEEEQRGEDRAANGSRLIEDLSHNLTTEFGKGFTARNLRFMREAYLAFPIWNAVRTELSWTHYRMLSRVQKSEARDSRLTSSQPQHRAQKQNGQSPAKNRDKISDLANQINDKSNELVQLQPASPSTPASEPSPSGK